MAFVRLPARILRCSLALLIAACSAHAGLISLWKFDDTTGTTAGDRVRMNDATWMAGNLGAPSWVPSGGLIVGTVDMPGSGSHQDYFPIPGFNELNGTPAGMTVSMWDNAAGTPRVFINGLQSGPTQSSSSHPANLSITGNSDRRIGDDACCSSRLFNGLMDDLAVWDHPLVPTEILTIYQNGLLGFSADQSPPPR